MFHCETAALADAALPALPALLAERVIAAVESAQRVARGPVTSAEALAHSSPRVARSPRAFTRLAERVAELEPRLSAAGTDKGGCALWLVVDAVQPAAPAAPAPLALPADLAARLEAAARAHGVAPAEVLRALLEPALTTIEGAAPSPLRIMADRLERFGSDGSDVVVSKRAPSPAEQLATPLAPPPPPAEPIAHRPDVRRSSEPIEMPPIVTPPEPRPQAPRENSLAAEPATDQQSPAEPPTAAPAGEPGELLDEPFDRQRREPPPATLGALGSLVARNRARLRGGS